MTVDERPWEPPLAGTEVEHLLGALERQRLTFRWKADGLDAAGLSRRIGASTLTIGRLLKHLAFVEDYTFTIKLAGEAPGEPWQSVDWDAHPEWPFASADADSPEQLYAIWDGAVERSRARVATALADGGLDQLAHVSDADGHHASLRRLLFDLLEEYARHTGHTDLVREAVDGRAGEDPPARWHPTGPISPAPEPAEPTPATYAALAPVYDWLVRDALLDPRDAVAAFTPAVDLIPEGGRVLDCACGSGQLAVGLAASGFEVAATDASPAMIARTRDLAAEHRVSLTTAVCTWQSLPAPEAPGPFDAVFCVGNSISHAAGRAARRTALAAMANLLSPNGVLAITARDWEQVRAAGDRVDVQDRLVHRRGRTGVVVRTWTLGETWDDAHHLEVAIALLGDDESVTTQRERLTLWAFRRDDLIEDLAAVGLETVTVTFFLGADDHLIVAQPASGSTTSGAHS
ncbi:MAG: DUF664 domain-containing protein [Kineosporiaceae bacterium]